MFLTKKQLEEIARQIAGMSVKDSDFEETFAAKYGDSVAIVQDGINKRIDLSELAMYFAEVSGELLPDNEDITVRDGTLSFADRSGAHGMGYVIPRRDKTFAEQVVYENTIYEIRYEFDLDGDSVTLPENCILKFNGGSITNGTIVGQATRIDADRTYIFGESVVFSGTWNADAVLPEWFGAVADGETDCVDAINAAIVAASDSGIRKIQLGSGTYRTTSTILIRNCTSLKGVSPALFPYGASGTIIYADFSNTKAFVISNYAYYNGSEVAYNQRLSGAQVTSGNFTPCRMFNLEDLRIQCKTRVFGGVRCMGCFGFLRRNISVINVYYGFVTNASWNGSDENLSVQNCLYSSFFLDSDVNCVAMKDCNGLSTTDAAVDSDYVYDVMTANLTYIKSYSSCLFARFAYSLYLENFCCEGGNVGKQFLTCYNVEDHAPYTENIKEYEYTVRATTIHLFDGFSHNISGCKGIYAYESNKIIDSGYMYNKGIEGKSNDLYINTNDPITAFSATTLEDLVGLSDNIFKNIKNVVLGADTITFAGTDRVIVENREIKISGVTGSDISMSSGFRPKFYLNNGKLYFSGIEFTISGSSGTNIQYTGIVNCVNKCDIVFDGCTFNLNGNSCVINNISAINGVSGAVTARGGGIINASFNNCIFNGTGKIVDANCKANALSLNGCTLNDTVAIGGTITNTYQNYGATV